MLRSDYRGLKKRITAIRKAHDAPSPDILTSEPEEDYNTTESISKGATEIPEPRQQLEQDISSPPHGYAKFNESVIETRSFDSLPGETRIVANPSGRRNSFAANRMGVNSEDDRGVEIEPDSPSTSESTARERRELKESLDESRPAQHTESLSKFENNRRRRSSLAYPRSIIGRRQATALSMRPKLVERLPLNELLTQLDPLEQAFFTALDAQLDKIDSFYAAREKEMMIRTKVLHEQLDELADHKKLIQGTCAKLDLELDTRTRMDYREYYEIPSLLITGLCYAFWLSFNRIGSSHVSPETWPLVWLGFCGLVVLEPLPLFYQSSRYWLVKSVGKLLISGTRRVKFTDFWMGDQLCSLVFTLSNFYFFACVYARGFDEDWASCGVAGSRQWPVMFVLASLPLLFRLVQSVKRYYDSGMVTHLINGGKYGSGIVSNLFFYMWRQRASKNRDSIFALWILFNTLYSIYASTWDLLMDWSVLRLRARYPLLRQELIYTNTIPSYYFAIVTNVLIRFIWVIYIPNDGPSMYLRTFIGAFLEMLRRLQWNFYRLENEHLGNMDQYRVTHEVPLPYSFDEAPVETADDDNTL
ncbi:hypothetical protein C0991_004997 [Blastosporella zonata]|nr:hypothetical protein C0991_004997 [Blastosporella zonata]